MGYGLTYLMLGMVHQRRCCGSCHNIHVWELETNVKHLPILYIGAMMNTDYDEGPEGSKNCDNYFVG